MCHRFPGLLAARTVDLLHCVMKNGFMKTTTIELALKRWPYGLELESSANGVLLRPRRKARANWSKSFRRPGPDRNDLRDLRRVTNAFDANEWQW